MSLCPDPVVLFLISTTFYQYVVVLNESLHLSKKNISHRIKEYNVQSSQSFAVSVFLGHRGIITTGKGHRVWL